MEGVVLLSFKGHKGAYENNDAWLFVLYHQGLRLAGGKMGTAFAWSKWSCLISHLWRWRVIVTHLVHRCTRKKQVTAPGKHGKLLLIQLTLLMQTYCFHLSVLLSCRPPHPPPYSSSRLNFCWLHCAINILCVIWLFWTARAWARGPHTRLLSSVRAACTHTHTRRAVPCHCIRASSLSVRRCQILLSQLLGQTQRGCDLSVCLSTFSPSFSFTLFPSLRFSSPSPCPALLSCAPFSLFFCRRGPASLLPNVQIGGRK